MEMLIGGMIIRNSEWEFLKLSTCVLSSSYSRENKLNVIHRDLVKAFNDNYKDVIIETDNLDAFKIIKNFLHLVPLEVAKVVQ